MFVEEKANLRLLVMNLATDADDPILGFTTGWIRALADRTAAVRVITMRSGRIDVSENVRVYSVGKEKGYSEGRRVFEFYRLLKDILVQERIDACFSHMTPAFTILAGPILRAKGIPVVTWYAHRQLTLVLKLAHRLSTRVVSVNSQSYPYLHDRFISLGHGIDTDLFQMRAADSDPERPLLLCVGRLSPIKDPLTFIKACALLRRQGHDIEGVLVGESPERDRGYLEAIQAEVRRLHLSEAIRIVEGVPQPQVVSWYNRCTAHINCPPSDGALDKAALEAMACGKPSLSSTLGFAETLGSYANRLMFKHGDPGDLAQKLAYILTLSKEERERLGRYLLERVQEMHSLKGLADKLIALSEELLHVRSGKRKRCLRETRLEKR